MDGGGGKNIVMQQETHSREDPFAVAVLKSGEIVGHDTR